MAISLGGGEHDQSVDTLSSHPIDHSHELVASTLDREMGLIREAIAMVASGASPRVIVASLHFGEALLEPSRRLAEKAGVRVMPLWTLDDSGNALAVEAIDA